MILRRAPLNMLENQHLLYQMTLELLSQQRRTKQLRQIKQIELPNQEGSSRLLD
jgi:hypothetical protein